ncbi:MAG: hypothetical protein IH865_11355 [Chloroflexi bacterium]|nr:hypothetical protein [Chloroflexota bacterium]
MRNVRSKLQDERGQILILVVLLTTVMLGVVGLAIDTGFHYVARRQLQNAADQATLAAAYEMQYESNDAAAITAALDNAAANGFDNDGTSNTVTVNIPATTGQYAGNAHSIEVVIRDLSVKTFFIHVLIPSTTQIVGRGVATLSGTPERLPVIPPDLPCDDDQAVVDGRVTPEEDYTSLSQLISDTTSVHYGEAFYACDAQFMYFALMMNGPSTGGAAANENVYGDGGGCAESAVEYNNGSIDEILGTIATVGASSFTVEADGLTITVDVDGMTKYRGDFDGYGDLTPGVAVEVIVMTDYGGLHVLAKQVKTSDVYFCDPGLIADGYHETYNTGWDVTHTYQKLEHSDRARFQITCDGTVRHDFIQDYLIEVGNEWKSDVSGDGTVIQSPGPTASASSLEWNLEHPEETGWELGLLQSPPFNPTYPSYDSAYDGWIWEMIYEFKVPIGPYSNCEEVTFGLDDFTGSAGGLEGMHSSPAKTEDGKFLQVGQAVEVRLVE